MVQVWLSGQIGMAVIQQGEAFYAMHITDRHVPQICDRWIACQMAQQAKDFCSFEASSTFPFPEVAQQLYNAWEEDRAIRVTLLSLDRAHSLDLRLRAADAAEQFLTSERLRSCVR